LSTIYYSTAVPNGIINFCIEYFFPKITVFFCLALCIDSVGVTPLVAVRLTSQVSFFSKYCWKRKIYQTYLL